MEFVGITKQYKVLTLDSRLDCYTNCNYSWVGMEFDTIEEAEEHMLKEWKDYINSSYHSEGSPPETWIVVPHYRTKYKFNHE